MPLEKSWQGLIYEVPRVRPAAGKVAGVVAKTLASWNRAINIHILYSVVSAKDRRWQERSGREYWDGGRNFGRNLQGDIWGKTWAPGPISVRGNSAKLASACVNKTAVWLESSHGGNEQATSKRWSSLWGLWVCRLSEIGNRWKRLSRRVTSCDLHFKKDRLGEFSGSAVLSMLWPGFSPWLGGITRRSHKQAQPKKRRSFEAKRKKEKSGQLGSCIHFSIVAETNYSSFTDLKRYLFVVLQFCRSEISLG